MVIPSEWLEQHGPSALGRLVAEVRGQIAMAGLLVFEAPEGAGVRPPLDNRITVTVGPLGQVVALRAG